VHLGVFVDLQCVFREIAFLFAVKWQVFKKKNGHKNKNCHGDLQWKFQPPFVKIM